MWTFLLFFYKKKQILRFRGSHRSPWYQMVSETFRVTCGRFPTFRSVQNTFRVILPSKNSDFRLKISGFLQLDPRSDLKYNLWWNQWFSAVRGAQRATGDQLHQKTFRNVISGPVSPRRGILGCLEVETYLNSLINVHILYKSFKRTTHLKGEVAFY